MNRAKRNQIKARQKILTADDRSISKHGFGAVGLARILKKAYVPGVVLITTFPSRTALVRRYFA